MEEIEDEIDRMDARIVAELARKEPRRVIGELIDRRIKICRIKVEICGRRDLAAQLDAAMATNRELAARIAGGSGGSGVLRADSAPPFVLEDQAGAH